MTKLKAQLTGFSLTMVVIGSCVGSGIFKTPASIASYLPEPFWILGIWLLGGIVTVAGALTYAELSSMFPRSGGLYVFLKETYSDLVGYLYGWANLSVIVTGAIAALSLVFASYANYLLEGSVLHRWLESAVFGRPIVLGEWTERGIAIAGILVLTFINVRGVRFADLFANLFTLLKIAGVALVVAVGLSWGGGEGFSLPSSVAETSENSLTTAIGLALIGVVFSFGGFQHATFLAGEARNPAKTVPRAMIAGTAAVTVIYLLVNIAYLYLMPIQDIVSSSSVAADAVGKVLHWGGLFVAILIAVSTFGTAGIYTLSAPRIYFAMADDKLFFPKIAWIHPRFQTPINAILLQSSWAIVLLFFWGTFERLITFLIFVEWIFLTLAAFAVVLMRIRKPNLPRPYKTSGYPVTPFIFIAIALFILGNTLINRPLEAVVGLGLLSTGLPIYFYFRQRSKHGKS